MSLPSIEFGGLLDRVFYVNPFRHATQLQVGRVDQGVDYHGVGRIDAIGRARIEGLGGQGWPGGQYILYKLLRGRHRGRYVYLAEGVAPCVKTGQVVRRGQHIASFRHDSAPGASPGIETGWASPILNETLAAATERPLPPNNANTVAGQCFARFLHHHGAPAPPVPNQRHGREYP